MNLKYVGGIVGLIGFVSAPFFMLGTTGSDVALSGLSLALFALGAVGGLVGSIVSLRGNTRIGGPVALGSGLALIALGIIVGKQTPWFTGAIIAVGGLIAFLYKEPVMTGSQWRVRRTPPSGTS